MATGTEGFAGLLSALKERSGRSYGALAGQLHMSTSTLHRYCNGDAVPTEYAPVERFARLCGATRDELVELHRQWILADDARRRGRAGAAESSDEPSVEPSREASAEPSRQASVEPSAEAASVPAPGPAAAGPVAVDGAAGEHDPEPGPEDVAAEPVVVGPVSASRRRRLRIAVATAAVVALAVPAAFAVSQFGGDGVRTDARGKGQSGARKGAGASTGAVAPSASASASVSASPSGSASPGGKGVSASPSDAAAEGRSQSPAGQGGGVAPSVGISSYNWEAPCGEYYLLDQQPGQVPPPPAPQDTRRWARALGGVSAGDMALQLTVTGNTDEAVVITALNVRVVGQKAPLPWQAYSMGEGCGSGVTPRTFDIDLDRAHPLAKPVAGQDGDTVVPAKDFPYKVSTRDPQVLNLDVHTEGHEVTWYLELAWSSGDRRGVVRVDDGGTPFRTSALEGRKSYSYWPDKDEWVTG
ncbi:helix-turn-helix domain-containing protein [Streptomyces sp. NPDC057445]|uniref:helix-turn-helix domain-containing protein n=1 Tax=Streptomyces sp. NPDC057445 TaxID=3346136 RepID=UPI003675BC77